MPRPSESARNRSLPPQNRGNGRTPAGLERLKTHIRKLEGFSGTLAEANRQILPFGIYDIDRQLPGGGLICGALHEVFAADAGIGTAFCALLAGKLTKNTGNESILWCERSWALDAGALYGPAFLQFGIDPERMILVRAQRDADALWAMEEGLWSGRVAAVVGELTDMSLTASRRLQLAAEKNGITVLSLRPATEKPAPSAALTRWRLSAVAHEECQETNGFPTQENDNDFSHPGLGTARWRAEMFRCRGGAATNWMMEWKDETSDLSLAAEFRNRPPLPSATRLAG
jgi:protein ImuA